MFHELVALVHVMVAVDVPFRFASVVAKLMVELAVMVLPAIGRIVVVGVWRSTNPEMVVLFPMFPTWSTIRQLSVNAVVWPAILGGVSDAVVEWVFACVFVFQKHSA